MTDEAITNQSEFQDDQYFDIDIEQLYTDFIQTIDESRSFVNITDPNNLKLLNNFTIGTFSGQSGIGGVLKPEQSRQESRCHAFYRLIGFPVVSSSKEIYNAGHDIFFSDQRNISLQKKVDIANNPLPGFAKLSIDRETYVNNFTKIFSNNTSIDSSVLAISSIILRGFASSFLKNPDAIEDKFSSDNQSYVIGGETIVSSDLSVSFLDYKDASGNSIDASKFLNTRKHIIKPFIVDARIDLSTPAAQKIGIPFLPDNSYLKITETASVKRPLLEKIILDRFAIQSDIATAGDEVTKQIDFIKQFDGITDAYIVEQMSSGTVYNTQETQQFAKWLQVIQAMMIKLVQALNTINDAQSQYYWLPVLSISGPEGGSTVQPVIQSLPDNLITENDRAIIIAKLKSLLIDIDSQASSATAAPDVASYAFEKFTVTFDPSTTSGFGDEKANTLAGLNDIRNHVLSDANNALKTVEIIMGEFSGLGLCDIVAIISSLYIIPKESLLGFLDVDSYARARLNPKLHLSETSPTTVDKALNDLTLMVNSFYNIMDQIYLDISQKNK